MSCERCNGDGMNVLLSFLLGGAVGAAVGVLYAPGSGEETRRKIKFYAEEAADKAVEKMQNVRTEAEQTVSKVKSELKTKKEKLASAIDAGKSAFKEEKDSLEENA